MRRLCNCAAATLIALVVMALSPLPKIAAAQENGAAAGTLSETPVPTHLVEIETADGRLLRFEVELARTRQEQARGLMFREQMAANAGMLFIFSNERDRAFWMRNTLISLDILYFDAEGRFVSVAANARPLDETSLPSDGPAQYVLEINGGFAAMLGIGAGSTLRSDALADAGLGFASE